MSTLSLGRFATSWANAVRTAKAQRLGLAAVFILNLLVSAFLAWHIITYQNYPFDSDEALHANRAVRLTFDLRRGDFLAFAQDSYQENVYPPAAAWLQSLFFLLFGVSTITARLFSLLCLVGSTFVLLAIGLELDKNQGWLIGLIGAGLTLVAQPVLVQSAMAMLELPGLLITLTTLWLYLRATRRQTRTSFILASLLLAFAMLTKYPYGLVLLATIGLSELLALWPLNRPGQLKATAVRWLSLFAPFALLMLLWFAGPGKVDGLLYYASLQPKQLNWYDPANLIFYPRSLALHYAPSPFFAPVLLAALLWAAKNGRNPGIRLLLSYFLIGLIVMTLEQSVNPRFILTIVPVLFLLVGALVARLATLIATHPRPLPALPSLALATFSLSLVATLPMLVERFAVLPALLEVEYETDPQANTVHAWIMAQTHQQRLYFINPWDQFSTFAMEWYSATHYTQHNHRFGDLFVPDTRLQDFSEARAEELEFQIRFYSTRYLVVLEGGREGWQNWPQYEHAFTGILEPVAANDFTFDYYDLTNWLKTNLVTRRTLAAAKEQHHLTLPFRTTIYQLLPPSTNQSHPVANHLGVFIIGR